MKRFVLALLLAACARTPTPPDAGIEVESGPRLGATFVDAASLPRWCLRGRMRRPCPTIDQFTDAGEKAGEP